MRITTLILAGIAVIAMNGLAFAQDKKPIVMGVDIESEGEGLARTVSRNGQYVLLMYFGDIQNVIGTSMYKWSANGAEFINRSPQGVQYMPAAISNDGNVIAYNTNGPSTLTSKFAVYLKNGRSQLLGEYDDVGKQAYASAVSGMTSNGSILVGQLSKYSTPTYAYNQPALFYPDGSVHMLPVELDPYNSLPYRGSASAITDNGSRIVGTMGEYAAVWDDIHALPIKIGVGQMSNSMGSGVSADGRYVVGSGLKIGSTNISEAFIWSDADGLTFINAPSAFNYVYALGVGNDGRVIGTAGQIINQQYAQARAYIWTQSDGMKFLDDILESQGTGMGEFEIINEIYSMSDDGNIIVGMGTTFDGRFAPFILGLGGEVPGITTPEEIENSVNDMPLAGQQSRSMLSNHMMQSLFVARNAMSVFLVPTTGLGGSADDLNDIETASGPSEFRGQLDAREASAYVIGSFGVGQGGEGGNDFDNHVYSGNAGILYKVNDDHVIGAGVLASNDKQNTYLGGNVVIKGYGVSGIYAYEPDMGMRFYAVASALRLDMDTKRHYRSGNTIAQSRGHTNGYAYGGVIRIGYALYPWADSRWQVMPYMEGEWSRVTLDAYREKRGTFPARIDKQSGNNTVGRFGAQLTHYMTPTLTLRARTAWSHRFSDTDSLGVSVANMTLKLPHAGGAHNWLELGGTALWMVNDNAMLSFDVTGVTGHTAEPTLNMMLGVSYKF